MRSIDSNPEEKHPNTLKTPESWQTDCKHSKLREILMGAIEAQFIENKSRMLSYMTDATPMFHPK